MTTPSPLALTTADDLLAQIDELIGETREVASQLDGPAFERAFRLLDVARRGMDSLLSR